MRAQRIQSNLVQRAHEDQSHLQIVLCRIIYCVSCFMRTTVCANNRARRANFRRRNSCRRVMARG
jgi:hypothetical protein